jgi:hypothetical protein
VITKQAREVIKKEVKKMRKWLKEMDKEVYGKNKRGQ